MGSGNGAPSQTKRTRASRPKVHTGCKTCKARRIKCDEGKPKCARCTNTGRFCEGYVLPKLLIERHRPLAPAGVVEQPPNFQPVPLERTQRTPWLKRSDAHPCLSAALVPASQISLTYQERWFLDFFRRTTSQTNATYFNKAFWGTLVHQASEVQPAVRHAAIGIGALHWGGMMKAAAAGNIRSFSLRQCSKALEHLRQNLTADIGRRPRMETVLVSCGILLAFAFSQGDAKAGGCHLRAGYELLEQWQKMRMDESPVGTVVLGSFYQIHLDWPALVDLEPGPKSYSYPLQLAAEYQLDVLIETPEEACGALLILGWLALQMKPQPYTGTFAESNPSAVLKRLQNWKHLILQRGHYLSQARRDTIAILDIWSEVLLIKDLTDGRIREGEMRYDDYSSHFLRTIQQGKMFTAQRSLQDSWVRSGVVAPLFFCAFKCRDWAIRREALRLLSGWGGEQGIWSVSKSSLVLDRLIKIESKDYQNWETIPESARIDGVRVEFLPWETKVRFWYRHPVRLDGEGKPFYTWAWDCELISY